MPSRGAFLALASVAAVLAVVTMVGIPFWTQAPAHALRPGDAKLVALGEKIYQTHCAACHGAKLEGQPNWRERGPDGALPAPPHDASGHTWHHTDEVLFRITKQGLVKLTGMKNYVSAMPVYEGVLSDEEIVAVLSWIKSQWSPQMRERHDELNAQHLKSK